MEEAPKKICFMVTPFGTKETQLPAGRGPAKINFDLLWIRLFEPLITALGYEPVRADADLGASIIRDMIERLALSDLVLADVTLPNANVFYEVGVRHAACETGCVLVAAKWTRQPFDTQSMRYEPYELTTEAISEDEARANRAILAPRVRQLADSKTPCYEMEGFPKLPLARAQTFRDWLKRMSDVNARITAIRLQPDGEERRSRATALVSALSATGDLSPVIAFELLRLLRDTVGWRETVDFIDELPAEVRARPLFIEQRALAQSKAGDHFEAIAALQSLIELIGPTPERHGLIGGRYKKLWREARDKNDPKQAARYLTEAITHYEAGRVLDLNQYYASSNLPLLLKTRNQPGDVEQATRVAIAVVAACERAIALQTADEWVYQTLLLAAFHGADVPKAHDLAERVRAAPEDWKLASVVADLKDAVGFHPPDDVRQQLETVLQSLAPAPPGP